jgi:outer membrane receptor for monomeric catechols
MKRRDHQHDEVEIIIRSNGATNKSNPTEAEPLPTPYAPEALLVAVSVSHPRGDATLTTTRGQQNMARFDCFQTPGAHPALSLQTPITRSAWQLTALIMAHGLAVHAQVETAPSAPTSGATNTPPAMEKTVITGQAGGEITSQKFTEPLLDTPHSISVVPRQTLDDQGATTLRDALRNVAGISLAAGEGGSQGDNLTLRGFTARNDIFLDGMRDFGSYYRDPFHIEQVEVLKGPESVLFGRGSTGGVVNQATKGPERTPFVSGSLSFGTDLTRRATLDVNERVPPCA